MHLVNGSKIRVSYTQKREKQNNTATIAMYPICNAGWMEMNEQKKKKRTK